LDNPQCSEPLGSESYFLSSWVFTRWQPGKPCVCGHDQPRRHGYPPRQTWLYHSGQVAATACDGRGPWGRSAHPSGVRAGMPSSMNHSRSQPQNHLGRDLWNHDRTSPSSGMYMWAGRKAERVRWKGLISMSSHLIRTLDNSVILTPASRAFRRWYRRRKSSFTNRSCDSTTAVSRLSCSRPMSTSRVAEAKEGDCWRCHAPVAGAETPKAVEGSLPAPERHGGQQKVYKFA
jgi:hypothetical protein